MALTSLLSVVMLAQGAGRNGPAGSLVLVNQGEQEVAVLDPATGDVLATAATGNGPHEVAISPDGKLAAVSNYGAALAGNSITLVDLVKGEGAGTIVLGDYRRPHGMAFTPDGKRLVVTAEFNECIVIVDLEAKTVVKEIETGQGGSHMVALSPDGSRAYVANVISGSLTVIDLEKDEVVATVPTSPGAEGLAVSPDGREVWIAGNKSGTVCIVNTESLSLQKTMPCEGYPLRVAFTPDGKRALVVATFRGEMAVYDVEKREEIKRIDLRVKEKPVFQQHPQMGDSTVPIGMAISPDGKKAMVSCKASGYVAVVDLEKMELAGYLEAGAGPDGVAFAAGRPADAVR